LSGLFGLVAENLIEVLSYPSGLIPALLGGYVLISKKRV